MSFCIFLLHVVGVIMLNKEDSIVMGVLFSVLNVILISPISCLLKLNPAILTDCPGMRVYFFKGILNRSKSFGEITVKGLPVSIIMLICPLIFLDLIVIGIKIKYLLLRNLITEQGIRTKAIRPIGCKLHRRAESLRQEDRLRSLRSFLTL